MVFTKEDEIKKEIDELYKRNTQILTIKWQAVGISITLISGFWILLASQIVDKDQKLGIMYLLFFLGVFFSIIILLGWRYIAHTLTEEETLYSDNIFVLTKLLKDPIFSELSEKQIMNNEDEIRKKEMEIRKKDLVIYHLNHCLSSEFDESFNLKDKEDGLIKREVFPKLYPEMFHKGQLRFDKWAFCIIFFLFTAGTIFFILIWNINDSTNVFFNFFKNPIVFWVVGIFFIAAFFLSIHLGWKYLFINFIRRCSVGRCEYIKKIINDDKQNRVCSINYLRVRKECKKKLNFFGD
jgi:hypothetical protein